MGDLSLICELRGRAKDGKGCTLVEGLRYCAKKSSPRFGRARSCTTATDVDALVEPAITNPVAPTLYTLKAPPEYATRWADHPVIMYDSVSKASYTTFDITTGRPVGRTLYVSPTGNNTNDGLTPATAKATVINAMGIAQSGDTIDFIDMTTDVIARSTSAWPATPGYDKSIAIRTSNGFRYIIALSSQTVNNWSQNATYPQVYQNARSAAPVQLIDCYIKWYAFYTTGEGGGYAVGDRLTLNNGAIIQVISVGTGGTLKAWSIVKPGTSLVTTTSVVSTTGAGLGATFGTCTTAPPCYGYGIKCADLATVAATPGGYFDDGTNTYYYPADGRAIAASSPRIVLATAGSNALNYSVTTAGSLTLYLRGVDIVGGSAGLACAYSGTAVKHKIYLENSSIQLANSNGLGVSSNAEVYGYRSLCAFNGFDNWNWHNFAGPTDPVNTSPKGFLNECVAIGAGTTGSTAASDNDYTVHEGALMTLLNCIACGSDDRTLGLIDDSVTWLVDGLFNVSRTSGTAQTTSSTIDTQNNATVYQFRSKVQSPSGGNAEAYRIGSGTRLYYADVTPIPATTGPGTIAPYVPY